MPRRQGGSGDAVRARIVLLVREDPGVHFRALQRALGLSPGQAVHHLRVLSEEGLVVGRRGGHYVHYFPPGGAPGPRLALAALRHPARRAIAERLASGPCGLEALATGAERSPSTVRHHVRVLTDAGAVAAEAGRPLRYRLSDEGRLALALAGHGAAPVPAARPEQPALACVTR